MIPLALAEVEALAPGRLERAPGAERIDGVSIDSRQMRGGDLFVAIGGGVEFVDDALAAGAAAALVPEDAFGALGALGRAVRERSAAKVVAVTGSTAKTSTKDILGALCAPHARTVVAEGSQNNEIGLPLTLCRLEEDTEIAIVEMGMRGLGQIAELCEIAQPDVGIVTSVGPVHLELLGTVERVAQAKAELIESLPPDGIAVVPAGETYLEPYLARDDIKVFHFGDGGDVSLSYFAAHDGAARIRVEAFGRPLTLEFSFSSRYNATNALAALAAYKALGLPLGKAQKGARHVQLSRLRGEEVPLPGGGVLLNDCYNANPLSMAAALEHLGDRAGDAPEGRRSRRHGRARPRRTRVSPGGRRRCSEGWGRRARRGRPARSQLCPGRARRPAHALGGDRRAGARRAPLSPPTRRLRSRQGLAGHGSRSDRRGCRRRPGPSLGFRPKLWSKSCSRACWRW